MVEKIRNGILIAIVVAIFYYLITHHIAFRSFTDFDVLKKVEPTFKYTFISVKQVNPYKLLKEDNLRDAGFGEYMLKKGLITEGRLNSVLEKIDSEYQDESEN